MTLSAQDLGIDTGRWNIDPTHSTVEFVVRHMMVSKVRGSFEKFEGYADIADDVTQSTVTATIDASTISTRDENRDNHLRSPDFLNVTEFPTITFTSTRIEPAGENWKLVGELTIRGVTRPVTLDLEFNGTSPDPYGGKRAGFSATGEISRKDFGIEWNAALETGGVVVSDKVTINIEIELVKA
ncbi:YceI family protein [Acidimicrobium ferrooxidans DSM 10331]|uniref:YceI family protein n=1 Tax=Acidimicrobium ferrooxidans (strain DSM 10331 / JCM 15462 / NBRC 103882 / ICP) TaxID=525909 RepID=C7M0Y0_ACIFD|nr:YceI family protein [Acidimicrobium ferrooxidans]ACU54638.1 YceI family protein [Acidimicrobium ferrooxidans DSM 10331]